MALSLLTLIPTRKVQAGGLTGIAVWGIGLALRHWGHVDIPDEVLSGIIAPIGFLVAYMVPPAERDVVAKVDTAIKADAASDGHAHIEAAFADIVKTGVATIKAGKTLPVDVTITAPAVVPGVLPAGAVAAAA